MESVDVAKWLSSAVVGGFSLFLIGLAVVIATRPSVAERFLCSFAGSARTHFVEQAVRLVVGAAMVNLASAMRYPELFRLFGWVIVISTFGLLLMPWQWHNKFAAGVMPRVVRHLRLFGAGALALGVFITYSLSRVVLS